MKKLALSLALAGIFAGSAMACTTIIADRHAVENGAFLVARSADSNALKAQHFIIHPATKGVKGTYSSKAHNGATDFTYPLPENGLRYTTVPNYMTGVHGATGFNEAGVGFSGTETIYASDEALKLDPYNEATGITEDDIPDVILPRVHSAREGIALLGKIVETQGAGEGFGVVFVDDKELWYFETGTGHQWLARRVPKDTYFATGNQGRLQQYEPNNPDFMASPTLVSWATEHGFYDPKSGPFNFAKAYTRDDARDREYNDPRVWVIQKMFNPNLTQDIAKGRTFPVFLTPEKKLTVADMKKALRNHYEGLGWDPYENYDNFTYRPISVFRTYESHVMEVRPELPRAIGEVNYIAFGMSDLGVYIPFYQGLSEVPKNFTMGDGNADNESAYWKFRKVQTLAMTNYKTLAPIVKDTYAKWEAQTSEEQKAFEKEYLVKLKKDPKDAQKFLDEFNTRIIKSAEAVTDKLLNELFTIRTKEIDTKYRFANRGKKD